MMTATSDDFDSTGVFAGGHDAVSEELRRRQEEAVAARFIAKRYAEMQQENEHQAPGDDIPPVSLPHSGTMAGATPEGGGSASVFNRLIRSAGKRIGGHTSLRIDLRSDKTRVATAATPSLASKRKKRGTFNAVGGSSARAPEGGLVGHRRSLLSSVGATGSRIKLNREWGTLDDRGYHLDASEGDDLHRHLNLFNFSPRHQGDAGGPRSREDSEDTTSGEIRRQPYFYRPRLRGLRASGGLSYDVDHCKLDTLCRLRADAVGANGGYGNASVYLLPSQEFSLKWKWRLGRKSAGAGKLFLETHFLMPLNQDTMYRNGQAMLGVKMVYPPGCGLHLGTNGINVHETLRISDKTRSDIILKAAVQLPESIPPVEKDAPFFNVSVSQLSIKTEL